MIGDTAFDIAMARAAGCRAIGVAWGYHAPDELLAAGAEAVAYTAAELEDLIDG
jgi:phosphoglycolate phosphatase